MPDRSSPRVALLGFSIECNKFAPPATKAHFLARTYLEGDAIVAEARSPTPTMLPETPGFVAAMDASGTLDAGRDRAGDDRAERSGRARLLCRTARHDQSPASRRVAARCRLHLLARGRADDRGGRSRRGPVRDGAGDRRPRRADRGDVGPARQCVGAHGPVDRCLHRLSDQPASRHARARRRGGRGDPRDARRRQAAARLHPPADRATDGNDADRRGSLRRDDRFRPAPDDPRDHQRLGDGRVCVCRHRQEWTDRRGDRSSRQTCR